MFHFQEDIIEHSVVHLAELLLMDQSTVTRNIEILRKNSYITSTPSEYDARIKVISITPLGEKKLEEAMPLWEQAQLEIKAKLGAQFTEFINTLQSINKYVK